MLYPMLSSDAQHGRWRGSKYWLTMTIRAGFAYTIAPYPTKFRH